MDGYYEVTQGFDGEVILRIQALRTIEMALLAAQGYHVHRRTFDRRVPRWMLDPTSAEA